MEVEKKKMTNLEYWKNELIKIREDGEYFAVKNGVPCGCNGISCENCDFGADGCEEKAINWLLAEYKEPEVNWNEDIDWRRVPIDTQVLVRESKIDEWKQAYFCIYLPACAEGHPFVTFFGNKTMETAQIFTSWKYCRLTNIEDLEKYRRKDNVKR